ncbi:MAG: thiamine pyrophosphate-binding protein [Elusimicrobia bacterium]|nr:thiamine pyrophosphate-binding protein [Elusimicrobiota bacterium]
MIKSAQIARTTASRLILDYLKEEGVDVIFGIPGGPATPIFDALYDERGIKTISTRHEAGAAFMAAGYARLSGRLGVCLATTGPGTTNLVTAVAAAKADSLPVLVLTAQVASSTFGKGSLQDSTYDRVDVVEMLRPATKLSVMVANAANLAFTLRQAIRAAMTGRRGPVHLNIPTDLMKKEVAFELWPPSQYRVEAHVFDREAIRRACYDLLGAKKPAILAGHGVALASAEAELLELAELLKIPVATTPKGKGVFPETHPYSLRVFGLASAPAAERYLLSGEVDVLMVVGSSLHEISTQGWEERLKPRDAFIQQDIDPGVIGRNYPVTVGLVGDAKSTLKEIIFHIKRLLKTGEYQTRSEADQFLQWKASQPLCYFSEKMDSGAAPLKPQRLIRDLQEALPEEAVLFVDSGNTTLWALHYLMVQKPKSFFHNWGDFGAMGYGVACPIGAKLAAPQRPVFAFVGDGAFGMLGMEVSTAVTYNIPVVWIVLNDGRYNTVYHGQQLQYRGRTIATEFHSMDIAKIAEALGAVGVRVDKPGRMQDVIPGLLKLGRPCVIDVPIDPDEVPPIHSRVESLERFFAGLAK